MSQYPNGLDAHSWRHTTATLKAGTTFGKPKNDKWRRDEEVAVATEATKMIQHEGRKVDADLFFKDSATGWNESGNSQAPLLRQLSKRSDHMFAEIGAEPEPRLVFLFAVRDMMSRISRRRKG